MGSRESLSERPLVVVPVGAFEQHGPHLPFDTDTVIAVSLVNAAVSRLTEAERTHVFVAPPVTVSASDEHVGFPGTLSAGTEATASLLTGIARSAAHWSRGTLFVNGHGGNADALATAHRTLTNSDVPHASWWPRLPEGASGDMHAGWVETSVMLHLDPDRVDCTRLTAGASGDAATLVAAMRERGVAAVSPNGVIGDPTRADPAIGAEIFAGWVNDLSAVITHHLRAWTPEAQ